MPAPQQAPVSRACQGPIEERFSTQDARIDELRSTVADMSKREEGTAEFRKGVESQFAEVRDHVKHQVQDLTNQFEKTLDRAMRRQDTQLEPSFSELKALILNKPVPSKKAKTEKPTKMGDDNDENL